jgi:hypothetical protein
LDGIQMDTTTADIITVPVGEPFRRISGIGRSRQFELIAAGELDSVLNGRRRLILIASYRAYLDRLRERENEGKRLPSPNPRARQQQEQQHEPEQPPRGRGGNRRARL